MNSEVTNVDVSTSMEAPRRIGMLIFLLVFGGFGLWAALAPLDGAAHAPGQVTVRSNKQLVQHLEGGIVRDILARNGDAVDAGQALLVLDDTQPLAQLEIVNGQFTALKAVEARLIAERDGLDRIQFPMEITALDSNAQSEMLSQTQIFHTRKESLEGSIEVLEQRIEQLQSRLQGLRALQESKQELATSFQEELDDVRSLLTEGFADKNRLRELERQAAQLRGEAAELTSSISSTEIEIGETRLQILQLRREFQNEVANQLAEIQTNLKDHSERMRALRDVVSRTTIRSPASGIVNGLQVHTIGGVIAPGNPIAEVVPQSDELIVEARVSPIDIDRVSAGQQATIRFSSFSSAVPNIFGQVINVSADSFTDQATGAQYYTARVEVTPEGLENLGDLTLLPGMPAEVFIATGSRTFLQYLMKPITNALARSFIED
ncbi:HlyD family type I secretion periplasmic adaptor subunit [Pseudohongiella spirulinae]|uniref:Membrane fusion protein (MFP) family protein n=1 Tax=Pseudohongiella spirulinae TaxID=1249552 RepID=A0A0S2K8V4_9GAMM|nr:HlyD family type I secretion periplasmic adaptor subunit [Pseudohongiella spirulinae]ALO44764.1 hemolysin secretion protein D [Pseudohongiella spirulinae]